MPDRHDEFPPSPLESDVPLPLSYVTHPVPRTLSYTGPSARSNGGGTPDGSLAKEWLH